MWRNAALTECTRSKRESMSVPSRSNITSRMECGSKARRVRIISFQNKAISAQPSALSRCLKLVSPISEADRPGNWLAFPCCNYTMVPVISKYVGIYPDSISEQIQRARRQVCRHVLRYGNGAPPAHHAVAAHR